jgi:hypothetical protein
MSGLFISYPQPGDEPHCPGVDSVGHGLTMQEIHLGGCCERWEAERQAAAATSEPEAEAGR